MGSLLVGPRPRCAAARRLVDGAVRAAELDRYGMEGVGEIYASYRDGWLTADADVALLHDLGLEIGA